MNSSAIFVNITQESIRKFRRKILTFAGKHGRRLPWRQTSNPYFILVSEVMLQQTQVSRVIGYYDRWIKEFPDFCSLGAAKNSRVLQLWSGLGYNSRALRLKECCKIICKDYNGVLPKEIPELKKLPGIGDYTSAALLAFVYNIPAPVIDINIRRVYLREFNLPDTMTNSQLSELAARCIPKVKSSVWHNALMDYGAALPKKEKQKFPPLTKQSKFDGSERQVRGEIIRRLLRQNGQTLNTLMKGITHSGKEKIILKLLEEKIITKRKGRIFIAE